MDNWHIGRHRPDNTTEERIVRCPFIQKFKVIICTKKVIDLIIKICTLPHADLGWMAF